MVSEELKSCPYCGADKPGLYVDSLSYVRCPECKMRGPLVCGYDEVATKVWNAIPRTLRWSNLRPEVEGWYWWRKTRYDDPEIVRVFWKKLFPSDKVILSALFMERIDNVQDIDEMVGDWAGPIPNPKEK